MVRDKLRILLIDDDAAYRLFARRALETGDWDLSIAEAATGEEGARRALEGKFDAILLDHHLPDTDGIAVQQTLRARHVNAPIIAMTGAGTQEIAVQFMKGGAADYLAKGDLTPLRLVQTVRNVVATRRLAGEVRRLGSALAEQERFALVGALSRPAVDGFHAGVEGLGLALAPVWRHVDALAPSAGGRAELLESKEDALQIIGALGEIEDQLRVLTRLLSDGADAPRIDADQVIGEMVRLLSRLAPRTIRIHWHPHAGRAVAIAPAALRQIVAHLVNNAMEAMSDGGEIVVETKGEATDLVLRVRDSGPGLPAELAQRAFDLHVTSKEGREGIGLTLVRHLAEQHGGTVVCENAGHPGAILAARFPLAQDH